MHRLPESHARRLTLQRHLGGLPSDQAEPVERLAQRVDHAAEHSLADVDRRDAARPLDRVALLDLVGRTEQHGPDIVLLEVHHDSPDAVLELQQLVGLRVLQAVDADHAVADLEHRAHLVETKFRIDPLELHPQHVRHLACLYTFRHTFQFFSLTFPAAAAQTIRRFSGELPA